MPDLDIRCNVRISAPLWTRLQALAGPVSPPVWLKAQLPLLADLLEADIGHPTRTLDALREQDRYLAEILKRDRVSFSEAEAALIVDACNGWYVEPHTVPLLWAQVEEAIRQDRLGEKWRVEGAFLVGRLRALTYSQAWYVCRAATQGYWTHYRDGMEHRASLRACGLVEQEAA